MTIRGWKSKYADILKEFKYSKKKDRESAVMLDSIIKISDADMQLRNLIREKTVLVIGSGPSLSTAIIKLKEYQKTTKIAADSSVKTLVNNGIVPDVITTDLDGDESVFKKISKTKTIFVVHAHGDNMEQLELARDFKNCIGTTQSTPFGKIQNFGGFTDGDRGVFLASHYQAERIILFGMDFGERIGKFSYTKRADRETKLMKLKKGRQLLEWLSSNTRSKLYTTSQPIDGFKRVSYRDTDIMILE